MEKTDMVGKAGLVAATSFDDRKNAKWPGDLFRMSDEWSCYVAAMDFLKCKATSKGEFLECCIRCGLSCWLTENGKVRAWFSAAVWLGLF